MKRIASLLLIVTLFYNVLGYYLMVAQQQEQAWIDAVQKNTKAEFKVIKLNASVYSFTEDTDFENVNENVVINNKTYHIFKKRIKDNVLNLYYLENSHQDAISKDLNEIANNQLFDNSPTKDTPVKKLLKSFMKDFVVHETVEFEFSPKPIYAPLACITFTRETLHSGHLSSHYSPPDFV